MSDTSYREIPLTKGYKAIVDVEDYEYLIKFKWKVNITFSGQKYAQRADGKYMHRIIMDAPINYETDHINRNTLDNRKCNLRLATSLQNSRNASKTSSETTSIFKGVHFRKERNSWMARIKLENERLYLGSYKTQEEAALAYNEAAKKYYVEFAYLNEIPA